MPTTSTTQTGRRETYTGWDEPQRWKRGWSQTASNNNKKKYYFDDFLLTQFWKVVAGVCKKQWGAIGNIFASERAEYFLPFNFEIIFRGEM